MSSSVDDQDVSSSLQEKMRIQINLNGGDVEGQQQQQKDDEEQNTLSRRGTELFEAGAMIDKFKGLLANPYDPETNPGGIVNVGVAENYVMIGENEKFARDNIHKVVPVAKDFSYGEGPWGTPRLRKAMARHINRLFKPLKPIEADRILFANGVTSLCEMLGLTICDAGDAVLYSRPIYQAFKSDFGTVPKVQAVYASFGDTDAFTPAALPIYEAAILSAAAKGIRVRALMLCHPHNPLGRCYTVETLIGMMQLCEKHKIHLLVDEIYAMSVYDVPSDPKAQAFHSILSLDTDRYINPEYLHLLYGMSKDFAGGGLRLGCIYTRNEKLYKAMSVTCMFAWSGNLNERVATVMLEDEEWMDWFFEESRRRLAKGNQLARGLLDEAGVKYYLGANAGFFLWVDLRPWLKSKEELAGIAGSGSEEDEKFKAEDELTGRLIKNGVFVTNGKELNAEEPGWYRLIFAQQEVVVREGIERIVKTIKG